MTHLTPDELIDALDGALAAARRSHLDTCPRCRHEAAELRTLLGEVRATDVPEPAPLFWDHLSARVSAAIADQAAPPPASRWFEWPVLLPLAGLALLVLALVTAAPLRGGEAGSQQASAATEGNSRGDQALGQLADADLEWALLADLMADLDLEAVHDAGFAATRGAADRALPALTPGERQELLLLLQAELKVGG